MDFQTSWVPDGNLHSLHQPLRIWLFDKSGRSDRDGRSLGYSHELVQDVTVLVLDVLLFVLQKAWVFRSQGIHGT